MRLILLASLVPAALGAQGAPRPTPHIPRPLPAPLQIRLAVQAAPAAMRDSVTVQGWDASGRFTTLRQGTAPMICVGPDPANAEGFEVSCHHRDLEAFLARGRALIAQGITGERRTRARWDEMASGSLSLPNGTVNAILTGASFDSATGVIREPYLRWVIYVPNATVASTGLSDVPTGAGQPWLMFAGTPGAHIMITPPRR